MAIYSQPLMTLAQTLEINKNTLLPELFSKVKNSVVQVYSKSPEGIRVGSGFVYDNNGHIITNYHLVVGSKDIDVRFADGTVYDAISVGGDLLCEPDVLYVPDVPKEKLSPLPLGNSKILNVGEPVIAMGNALDLSGSMTEGIIRGLSMVIPPEVTNTVYPIPDIIQTNAPIDPFNYGGPLINMQGEVIGMNTAFPILTGKFSGIGFAIPSNTIKKVLPSLIANGSFNHPWSGIVASDVTPEIVKSLGLKEQPRGAVVTDVVPGSPADKAGIDDGDIIVKIDNKTVGKVDDILNHIQREKKVNDNLNMTIIREGNIQQINLTLTARPEVQFLF